MKATTYWRAYRAARARANWNVHDRESFRQQRLFEERVIRILETWDEAWAIARSIGHADFALGAVSEPVGTAESEC